jgi:Tfp pilus assembly protein FimT
MKFNLPMNRMMLLTKARPRPMPKLGLVPRPQGAGASLAAFGQNHPLPVPGFKAQCGQRNPAIRRRRTAGILLTECLVYFAVFSVLTGVAMGAFYLCWNQTQALSYATDDISAALRAGEQWRAEVRAATGRIAVESESLGERVRIPCREGAVVYHFESGTLRRETANATGSRLVLPRVTTSAMSAEVRNGLTAWRWELELASRRPETQLPLLFTFEAVRTVP